MPSSPRLAQLGIGLTCHSGHQLVIATAVRHQAPIVTSDSGALTHIADAIGVKIRLYAT